MREDRIFRDSSSIDFSIPDIEDRNGFETVMMIDPEFFEVESALNSLADAGSKVDREKARIQWQNLKRKYEELGFEVNVIDGVKGLTDMVFAANQSLPHTVNGEKKAVMSNMATEQRAPEVEPIKNWYEARGFKTEHISSRHRFEGMGDAIWHPGKNLIWGGYGHRSSEEAYEEVSEIVGVDVITLQLVRDEFYHLDTCFSALDSRTVMICPEAFKDEGLKKIEKVWEKAIRIGIDEAVNGMACNAHCPDGENVIMQEGNPSARDKLEEEGFQIHEVDTSEFMKSGGSVFCMKMMIPGGRGE